MFPVYQAFTQILLGHMYLVYEHLLVQIIHNHRKSSKGFFFVSFWVALMFISQIWSCCSTASVNKLPNQRKWKKKKNVYYVYEVFQEILFIFIASFPKDVIASCVFSLLSFNLLWYFIHIFELTGPSNKHY